MVKYEHKEYNELSKSSKSKIASALQRLDRAGITTKQAKEMSNTDLRKAIGFKGKKTSFEGFKRNVYQITFSQEHRKESVKIGVGKYKQIGWKGIKLKQLEKDLTKTAGSSFISIADELEKIGYTELDKEGKKLSWKRAEFLLKIPKDEYSQIPIKEREILADYGT